MDNFTVLSIPEISNERQIWLIRTNGGLYYNDFPIINMLHLVGMPCQLTCC